MRALEGGGGRARAKALCVGEGSMGDYGLLRPVVSLPHSSFLLIH